MVARATLKTQSVFGGCMPEITVTGMSCQHCVRAVTQALESVEGITEVQVDLPTGRVQYTQTEEVPPVQVRQAVQAAGYDTTE